jgi:hypothetical protein
MTGVTNNNQARMAPSGWALLQQAWARVRPNTCWEIHHNRGAAAEASTAWFQRIVNAVCQTYNELVLDRSSASSTGMSVLIEVSVRLVWRALQHTRAEVCLTGQFANILSIESRVSCSWQ